MILILILVIPVMIAMVITLLAGFVGREMTIPEITKIEIPAHLEPAMTAEFEAKTGFPVFNEGFSHPVWTVLGLRVGDQHAVDLTKFVRITPQKARWQDLNVEYLTLDSPVIITETGLLKGLRSTPPHTVTTINIKNGQGQTVLTFAINGVSA